MTHMNYVVCLNIFARTVRLLFDLLHGIKRMDVSFVMALEFAILLGFDGQLEDSDMENELFTSVIDQLKEGSKSFQISFIDFFIHLTDSGSLNIEHKNDATRKCTCMALCEDLGKIR